jgi:hypothetical protein
MMDIVCVMGYNRTWITVRHPPFHNAVATAARLVTAVFIMHNADAMYNIAFTYGRSVELICEVLLFLV